MQNLNELDMCQDLTNAEMEELKAGAGYETISYDYFPVGTINPDLISPVQIPQKLGGFPNGIPGIDVDSIRELGNFGRSQIGR